ncbi:MAG: hypothetical protein ACRDPM_06140 [Solirubrobacteraceae bacterium]
MRAVAAACVVALLAAAPAAAVSGDLATMKFGRPILATVVSGKVTGKDKSRSCQAGKNAKTKVGLLGSKRRFPVVSCEYPPRSNLVTPSSIAKATAAALSVLG